MFLLIFPLYFILSCANSSLKKYLGLKLHFDQGLGYFKFLVRLNQEYRTKRNRTGKLIIDRNSIFYIAQALSNQAQFWTIGQGEMPNSGHTLSTLALISRTIFIIENKEFIRDCTLDLQFEPLTFDLSRKIFKNNSRINHDDCLKICEFS